MKPDYTASPLAADDPRLSEWIDGRLPAAEAAEIARAVAASPELSRLVADLRGIKKSLASLPPSPPPAAFVGDVMAALDATAVGGAEDADVEAEWRKIERERLEEEIAEAREDAAAPVDEPMRHRWPWLALAAALAAGVLVAVVINRPPLPGEREVALARAPQAESSAKKSTEKMDAFAMKGARSEFTDRALAEAKPGNAAATASAGEEPEPRSVRRREAADSLAKKGAGKPTEEGKPLIENQNRRLRDPGAEEAKKQLAQNALSDKPGADGTGGGMVGGGGGGGEGRTVDHRKDVEQARAALMDSPPAAAAAPATGAPGDPVAGLPARAKFGSPADAAGNAPVRVVQYRVRTTADRARLDDLVAASHDGVPVREAMRKAMQGDAARGGATENGKASEKLLAAAAEQVASPESAANRPGGKTDRVRERIEVSGSADEIAALVATLEAGRAGRALDRAAAASDAELQQEPGRGKDEARDQLALKREAAERGPGAPAPFANDGSPEAEQSGAAIDRRPAVVRLIIEVIDESGSEAAEGGP